VAGGIGDVIMKRVEIPAGNISLGITKIVKEAGEETIIIVVKNMAQKNLALQALERLGKYAEVEVVK